MEPIIYTPWRTRPSDPLINPDLASRYQLSYWCLLNKLFELYLFLNLGVKKGSQFLIETHYLIHHGGLEPPTR